jgi:hypothetical protein
MEGPKDTSFVRSGIHYRLRISIPPLTISLFDDDNLDRWIGTFTPNFLEEICRKSGAPQTASSFWELLQSAVSGTSPDVSFDIISAAELSHFPKSTNKFLVICNSTALNWIRYPLVLRHKPYKAKELQTIARDLKTENRKLKGNPEADVVGQLESQLCELTATMKRLESEKERTIAELRRRIYRLELGQRRTPMVEAATDAVVRRVRRSAGNWGGSCCGCGGEKLGLMMELPRPRTSLGTLDTDWRRIRALINERYKY